MSHFAEQLSRVSEERGFLAALDQSGGSTPKALAAYGVDESAYTSEEEMFDQVHAMRSRLMTNSAFSGERILGAILFEQTMDRTVEGVPTPRYLWEEKRIVPFLKVDRGLLDRQYGAQLMKEIHDLDDTLAKARKAGIFGTKMRSVIHADDAEGITGVVDQQFRFARRICAAGLIPIIEPEVSIKAPDKSAIESQLRDELMSRLDALNENENVMLKLTLPEKAGLHQPCQDHPRVVRVVALSGGYSRDEANDRLRQNPGLIASFSRALAEGLTVQQTDDEFTATLDRSVQSIYDASVT